MDRYEEALEKARAEYEKARKQGYTWLMDLLEGMFPDLKESEDERIRRHLIDIVETYWGTTNDPGKDEDLAWLEKRKEYKPEWSEEDKEMVRRALFYTEQYRTNYGDTKESEECFNWLLDLHRNIRPPFHWKPSKEQMGMLLAVINDPNNAGAESCHLMLQSLYADLQKLL